jgi:hypothetical protein
MAVDRIRSALPGHVVDYRDSDLPLSPADLRRHVKVRLSLSLWNSQTLSISSLMELSLCSILGGV